MCDGGSKESYIAKAIRYWKRFGELAIGLVANERMVYAFNLIFYQFVIYL